MTGWRAGLPVEGEGTSSGVGGPGLVFAARALGQRGVRGIRRAAAGPVDRDRSLPSRRPRPLSGQACCGAAVHEHRGARCQHRPDRCVPAESAEHGVAGVGEVDLGSADGVTDPAVRAEVVGVLRSWIVEGRLEGRACDGETGSSGAWARQRGVVRYRRRSPDQSVIVFGHVASLTTALAVMCRLGARVWGRPLPHATPFLIHRQDLTWRCDRWPVASSHSVPA